jgi:hypothetical protein
MKKYIEENLIVAFTLTLIAAALIIGSLVAHYSQRRAESLLSERIQVEKSTLLNLATITDRNGADAIIENIVNDCSRRSEYEGLLESLETLSKKDLISAQNLFESCGTFYAERKALMVAKLERELEAYVDFVALLSQFQNDVDINHQVLAWKDLVSLESTRSSLLSDQAHLQSKIITLLISGSLVSSKEVINLVRDAGEISELLSVHDHRIDELRASLEK